MNSFRTLLYSLIVISLTLTNVKCYIPDPRTGQASVLVGSNLYFFGGNRSPYTDQFIDQVLYLNLSSSFNTLSPPWSQIATSPIPTSLYFPFPCLSTDGSTIYLVEYHNQIHQFLCFHPHIHMHLISIIYNGQLQISTILIIHF
ncbi:hypothetical protein C2G38_1314000 [Gigaspora rosea]|uniref:Galactose oxidase n=1 Tax=Gigaspora rosea TaxID=44941 RepID=A0A397W6J1_9GLOM|nr:hypothetical protein C2G38_1314000 [Gigaspora rosea]